MFIWMISPQLLNFLYLNVVWWCDGDDMLCVFHNCFWLKAGIFAGKMKNLWKKLWHTIKWKSIIVTWSSHRVIVPIRVWLTFCRPIRAWLTLCSCLCVFFFQLSDITQFLEWVISYFNVWNYCLLWLPFSFLCCSCFLEGHSAWWSSIFQISSPHIKHAFYTHITAESVANLCFSDLNTKQNGGFRRLQWEKITPESSVKLIWDRKTSLLMAEWRTKH